MAKTGPALTLSLELAFPSTHRGVLGSMDSARPVGGLSRHPLVRDLQDAVDLRPTSLISSSLRHPCIRWRPLMASSDFPAPFMDALGFVPNPCSKSSPSVTCLLPVSCVYDIIKSCLFITICISLSVGWFIRYGISDLGLKKINQNQGKNLVRDKFRSRCMVLFHPTRGSWQRPKLGSVCHQTSLAGFWHLYPP
jgi:hypothetical protein